MLKLFGALCAVLLPFIIGIPLFFINPIVGVLWTLWFIGVAIYTIKFKKN